MPLNSFEGGLFYSIRIPLDEGAVLVEDVFLSGVSVNLLVKGKYYHKRPEILYEHLDTIWTDTKGAQ